MGSNLGIAYLEVNGHFRIGELRIVRGPRKPDWTKTGLIVELV